MENIRREGIVCGFVWSAYVFYLCYSIYHTSIKLEDNKALAHLTNQGWKIFNRRQDTSDVEWLFWKTSLLARMFMWICVHVLLSICLSLCKLQKMRRHVLPFISVCFMLCHLGFVSTVFCITQIISVTGIALVTHSKKSVWFLALLYLSFVFIPSFKLVLNSLTNTHDVNDILLLDYILTMALLRYTSCALCIIDAIRARDADAIEKLIGIKIRDVREGINTNYNLIKNAPKNVEKILPNNLKKNCLVYNESIRYNKEVKATRSLNAHAQERDPDGDVDLANYSSQPLAYTSPFDNNNNNNNINVNNNNSSNNKANNNNNYSVNNHINNNFNINYNNKHRNFHSVESLHPNQQNQNNNNHNNNHNNNNNYNHNNNHDNNNNNNNNNNHDNNNHNNNNHNNNNDDDVGFLREEEKMYLARTYVVWEDMTREEWLVDADWLGIMMYNLYFPLLATGPFMTFKDFSNQIQNAPLTAFTLQLFKKLFKNLTKVIAWSLLLEISSHFLYHHAIVISTTLMQRLPLWSVAGAAYVTGQCFMVKYFIIWTFTSSVASIDGLTTASPPSCISHIYLYSDMWKLFDKGFYQFLKCHIYIPLGGHTTNRLQQCFSLVVPFLFVYLWHGANADVMVWTSMNVVAILLEKLLADLYSSQSFIHFCNNNFSRHNTRRFETLILLPLFGFSTAGIFVFLASVHSSYALVYRIFIAGFPVSFLHLVVVGYCFVQFSKFRRDVTPPHKHSL